VSRIALDAMGGDHAPSETVAGAVEAASEGIDVVLVGDRDRLGDELRGLGADLPIRHAPETIGMAEDPARAVRAKAGSSIVVCGRMVRDGDVAGFVSAGSTGAAMATAAILVGRVAGVSRPTIASVIPKPSGRHTVVLDAGANPEVKPEHLVEFAMMGSVLAEVYHPVVRARVGLLSNGEERGKGRTLEKEAYALLEAAPIDFIGNVEGRDLASDRVDVIVTDGFTGNVLLKTTEGVAGMVAAMVVGRLSALTESTRREALAALAPLREQLDYENTGGAHLLGVKGVVVIAHGSSTRVSVRNALHVAAEGADRDLVARVTARIGIR
jgi:glycerol-3-phosphate acyltransferase PlsX